MAIVERNQLIIMNSYLELILTFYLNYFKNSKEMQDVTTHGKLAENWIIPLVFETLIHFASNP